MKQVRKNATLTPSLSQAGLLTGLGGFGLLFMLSSLVGCGGGSSSPSSPTAATATSGRAAFTVSWPARTNTRLIPLAANSIRVDLLRNGAVIATQLLARPANGGSATLNFANLPIDTLTARATAFPQADGSGTAQAAGSVPVPIVADQITSFSLTMTSTIDHLDAAPAGQNLAIGQTVPMTATAWDAPGTGGNVVLVLPNTLQWVSSNSTIATVDANGLVTAVSGGTVTIRVTERESGKTTTLPVGVIDPFAGVKQYTTLNLQNLFNYANPVFPVHYDANLLAQNNIPPNNPITDKGATLGRVLFFDKHLSVNDTIACASCHQQNLGMTDSRQFSVGFSGSSFTTAHAMRLGNSRFYIGQVMFWDKRAASVEAQASQPIQNAIEMGFDTPHGGITAVLGKMATLPYYPELFQWVYGDSAITEDRIQKALAQYERSMVSVNSRFDTGFAQVFNPAAPQAGIGNPFPNYTALEERGKQLFLQGPGQGGAGCNSCHKAPTFALDANSRSNGLDAGETTIFKSPSLKNLALTGPYMHDGRFQTLEQVVDHYISGVQNGPALDNRLKNGAGQPQRLPLTVADRDAIVAFLKTLSDPVLTSDPKFTTPFRP